MSRQVRRVARAIVLSGLLLLAACGDDCDDAAAPPAADKTDITAVQLNFLHGFTGAGCMQSANCRLEDRADLLFQWIAGSGCPDVVTLQETWSGSQPLIRARLGSVCPFTYEAAVAGDVVGIDQEMVLSRYPVIAVENRPLFPGFRKVMHARIDHPIGAIDVYTTHLASGSDGGPVPCNALSGPCPDECLARGAQNRRDCQAVQMVDYIEATRSGDAPAIVAGDFNSEPGSFVYRQFSDRGWSDAYLAAGNPECDPETGVGCTSGRDDSQLAQLESTDSNETERIDFIFVIPPRNDFPCAARLDPAGDRDGDGTATRTFSDEPNPFADACGAAPLPICWPSDHEGVELDLNCR